MQKKPSIHEDPSRTTPLGLIRYADEFFEAALNVDEKMGQENGFVQIPPTPVLYLTGHAIELALKAYLVKHGVPLRDLKTKFGHDLGKCLKKAKELGLLNLIRIDEGTKGAFDALDGLYSTKQLEYIVTGSKVFPVFGPLESFTDALVRIVATDVGYHKVRERGFVGADKMIIKKDA